MTQKDKELLLQDLCARLPFKVKISVNDKIEPLQGINILDNIVEYGSFLSSNIEEIKPCLFPLSIISNRTLEAFNQFVDTKTSHVIMEFFNSCHIDYRGLIEKGLAIDATGLNIY